MSGFGVENLGVKQSAIESARLAKGNQLKTHDSTSAREFVAAFKQAAQLAKEVSKSDKKERENDQKKRGYKHQKEDFEFKDEVEDLLAEIDERLNKILDIAEELDD